MEMGLKPSGSLSDSAAAARVQRHRGFAGTGPAGSQPQEPPAPARAPVQAPRRARSTGLAFFGDAITPEPFLPRRAGAAPGPILPSLTDASPAHTQHDGKLRFWRNQELKLHLEPVGQAINSIECPMG